MKFNTIDNPFTLKRLFGTVLMICASLIIMGCSPTETTEDEVPQVKENIEVKEDIGEVEQDTSVKDKEAIQAVIEKEFTGPDEKYRYLADAVQATQTRDMNQEEYDATLEMPPYKNFMTYLENTYAPYFTENAYETFINTGAFSYSFPDGNYKLNVSDIKINRSDNGDTLYDFTFTVNFEDANGERGDYDFEGNAIVPEEGKIGRIQFNDKDGLSDRIRQ